MTFAQKCLNYEQISLELLTELFDESFAEWLNTSTPQPLSEFLGFSQDQFRVWFQNPLSVKEILDGDFEVNTDWDGEFEGEPEYKAIYYFGEGV